MTLDYLTTICWNFQSMHIALLPVNIKLLSSPICHLKEWSPTPHSSTTVIGVLNQMISTVILFATCGRPIRESTANVVTLNGLPCSQLRRIHSAPSHSVHPPQRFQHPPLYIVGRDRIAWPAPSLPWSAKLEAQLLLAQIVVFNNSYRL